MTPVIYLVDDEQSVRHSTELLLSTFGYEVRCFASAADFLANAPPDGAACAIVDIRMPEIDGLRLLAIMRERGWTMPVIMASGHTDPRLGVEAIAAGAFDVAEKPYAWNVLAAIIDRALATSK